MSEERHPLARMVEMDEEVEMANPGWMTGKSDDEPCTDCGGAGEYYGHAPDCDNDSCALAMGIDDCAGQVIQCYCTLLPTNQRDPV